MTEKEKVTMTAKETATRKIREQKKWIWQAAVLLFLPILPFLLMDEWGITLIIAIGCGVLYLQQYKHTKDSIKFWKTIENIKL